MAMSVLVLFLFLCLSCCCLCVYTTCYCYCYWQLHNCLRPEGITMAFFFVNQLTSKERKSILVLYLFVWLQIQKLHNVTFLHCWEKKNFFKDTFLFYCFYFLAQQHIVRATAIHKRRHFSLKIVLFLYFTSRNAQNLI